MFINKKKEGIWKSWYKTGQLESEDKYKNDKQEGWCKYWVKRGEEGQSFEMYFENGTGQFTTMRKLYD